MNKISLLPHDIWLMHKSIVNKKFEPRLKSILHMMNGELLIKCQQRTVQHAESNILIADRLNWNTFCIVKFVLIILQRDNRNQNLQFI